jgi:hypothetical protein
MAKEKQPIGSRARIFLSALALGGSLAAGCGRNQQPSPTETPRVSPSSTPTTEVVNPTATIELSPTASPIPTPTEIVEPTPEKEVVYIPGITIDEDYLRSAFAGIGGEEVIENGQQETTALEFGQDYVSQSWGEEIDLASLSENPIASLQYLTSLGSYQGVEGVFSPGGQGEEAIFPQLADLSLFRITLNNVPSEEIQRTQDYREQTVPRNFKLYPGTQMTVVGLLEASSEGQPAFALVAFTDYLRASEENGVPRHYLALLSTHFPDDPENRNTLSLANRLEANSYGFDPETKTIIINNDEKKVVLEPNYIQGEDLAAQIEKEVGIYFVDQINGEQVENPVVPYPDEMPNYWAVMEGRDEEGNVGLFLYGAEEINTDLQKIAQAHYDQETGEWGWRESVYLEAEPFLSQEEEEKLYTDITSLSPSIVGGELAVEPTITPAPEPSPTLSPEEQQFYEDITRVFKFEDNQVTQTIIDDLEQAKEFDPQKSEVEAGMQYLRYTSAASTMIALYYSSGDNPQNRNQEMLGLIAKVRELARQNSHFNEEDWKIEGVESY